MKILIALIIATAATLAPEAVTYGNPPTQWSCAIAPIQGGNDELDSAGMGAPVTWGRACQSPNPS